MAGHVRQPSSRDFSGLRLFARRSHTFLTSARVHAEEWLLILLGLSTIMAFSPRSQPSTLSSILRQLCPRCRSGRIFRSTVYWGFPKMNDRCPACGLHFNREPGYFLGAMYISYGLGLALVFAFGAILWVLTRWRLDKVAIWAVLFFLPFAPMLTFLSRVLWIYFDQKIDPETN